MLDTNGIFCDFIWVSASKVSPSDKYFCWSLMYTDPSQQNNYDTKCRPLFIFTLHILFRPATSTGVRRWRQPCTKLQLNSRRTAGTDMWPTWGICPPSRQRGIWLCMCVCFRRMNITTIDRTNVGRKGCRPQQIINTPLMTLPSKHCWGYIYKCFSIVCSHTDLECVHTTARSR